VLSSHQNKKDLLDGVPPGTSYNSCTNPTSVAMFSITVPFT